VDLTSDDVQEILALLDGLPFGEMHLQTARFSLWLRRTADGEWTQELQVLSEPAMTPAAEPPSPPDPAPTPAAPDTTAPDTTAPDTTAPDTTAPDTTAPDTTAPDTTALGPPAAETDGLRPVRAPLPGTFYRAPMPGAPPFVEVGSRVEPDTVVGIVETMKLMNSVPAGVGGTVAEILLANAEFAEPDAVLMRIREDP
jgi:acetyl-CoA carboxylase biotin carboxyl carrier protein